MANLHELSQRVRECRTAPNADNRTFVYDALSSKWEGVQAVALQVLGHWGDVDSRKRLMEFVETVDSRPYGWSIRGVAVGALAECVTASEAQWALDRYFSLGGVLKKHEFLPVVSALPPEVARERLLKETHSPDRDNRQAAMKAIAWMPFRDRSELLRPFLNDADDQISRAARKLLDDAG